MRELRELIRRLEERGLVLERAGSFDGREINHLANDSRKVGPEGLFVAISGGQFDGHLFIDKAVKNGAIAIACEAMPANQEARFPGIAFVRVKNSRAALAELAAAFYGDPANELTMLGVTGTNGKTTVTFLLHFLLSALGRRPGLIGTIEVRMGDHVVEGGLTTPDTLDVQRLLRQMANAGCDTCAMEVSSHALDQERVRSIRFDSAIFTNLTRDHLDYHVTRDAYQEAKKRLFDGLEEGAAAIYNADDPAGLHMIRDTRARIVSFGIDEPAMIRGAIIEDRTDGLRMILDGEERHFHLVGRFNAYNLLATYAAARSLGLPGKDVLDALAASPSVPGRFEIVRFDDGTTAVIDYAHTPDALENVLRTIRETKDESATLWCVFGCGGDRDREKRPMMGAIAERLADEVIVTSDNPRTEDPTSILQDIRQGMANPDRALWIVDRREAIREAARRAKAGDVVLIAGKGHETYQVIGREKLPFDDRQIVREGFADRHDDNLQRD